MNKIFILILCLCCVVTSAWGDDTPALNPSDANIVGHILDKETGEHLAFITVFLKGTTIGTTTDATGHYYLKNLPEGKFTLVMKTLGYKTVEKPVTLKKGKTLEVNLEVEEDAVSLDGVVVSANRNETTRRLAPSLSGECAGFENIRDYTCDFSGGRSEFPTRCACGKQLSELRFPAGAYQWSGRSLYADTGRQPSYL